MAADAGWSRVSGIFHRALELPASDRSAYLDTACAGNAAMRAELDSLLRAHEQPETAIDRPAAQPDAAAYPLIGTTVGQYRISGVLGEGGMGVVYLATDTRLGRTVALKAIAPQFTADPSRRDRLRREARAAAALSHPGIATVYALEEIDGSLYIASEHVSGATLRDELAIGPMPADRVLDIARQIARALAAAHDRGIVHRDLKPENVMRGPGGDIKIVDFGLARFSEDLGTPSLSVTGTLLGTPAYMAPEQIRGEATDPRTDMFAFGVLVYELSTGARPFIGHDAASTIAKILEAATPSMPLGAPPALADVVRRCLQKAPGARYATTQALVEALDRGAGAVVAVTPREPLWWWQFHQAAASAAYVALVVPLWIACALIDDGRSRALFLTGVAAVVLAVALRLHVRFTVRSYPAEWPAQRARTGRWIRLADVTFVLALLAGSALMLGSHFSLAAGLFAAAVSVLVSFMLIEPATTRAAFP